MCQTYSGMGPENKFEIECAPSLGEDMKLGIIFSFISSSSHETNNMTNPRSQSPKIPKLKIPYVQSSQRTNSSGTSESQEESLQSQSRELTKQSLKRYINLSKSKKHTLLR